MLQWEDKLVWNKPFHVGQFYTNHGFYSDVRSLHFHSGLEILAVVDGEGTQFINDQSFPIRKDDIVFLDPVHPHYCAGNKMTTIVAHCATESVINLHVDKGDLRLLLPFVPSRATGTPVLINRPDIANYFITAHRAFIDNDPFGHQVAWIAVATALVEIARSVRQSHTGRETAIHTKNIELTGRIIELLNRTFLQNLSLGAMAKMLCVSVSTLAHTFKDNTGQSVVDYRNRLRVINAIEEIRTTDTKLSVIADQYGFHNIANFYRIFKKITGTTPTVIRSGAE